MRGPVEERIADHQGHGSRGRGRPRAAACGLGEQGEGGGQGQGGRFSQEARGALGIDDQSGERKLPERTVGRQEQPSGSQDRLARRAGEEAGEERATGSGGLRLIRLGVGDLGPDGEDEPTQFGERERERVDGEPRTGAAAALEEKEVALIGADREGGEQHARGQGAFGLRQGERRGERVGRGPSELAPVLVRRQTRSRVGRLGGAEPLDGSQEGRPQPDQIRRPGSRLLRRGQGADGVGGVRAGQRDLLLGAISVRDSPPVSGPEPAVTQAGEDPPLEQELEKSLRAALFQGLESGAGVALLHLSLHEGGGQRSDRRTKRLPGFITGHRPGLPPRQRPGLPRPPLGFGPIAPLRREPGQVVEACRQIQRAGRQLLLQYPRALEILARRGQIALVRSDDPQVVQGPGDLEGVRREPLFEGEGAAVLVPGERQVALREGDGAEIVKPRGHVQGIRREPFFDRQRAAVELSGEGQLPLLADHVPQIVQAQRRIERIGPDFFLKSERLKEEHPGCRQVALREGNGAQVIQTDRQIRGARGMFLIQELRLGEVVASGPEVTLFMGDDPDIAQQCRQTEGVGGELFLQRERAPIVRSGGCQIAQLVRDGSPRAEAGDELGGGGSPFLEDRQRLAEIGSCRGQIALRSRQTAETRQVPRQLQRARRPAGAKGHGSRPEIAGPDREVPLYAALGRRFQRSGHSQRSSGLSSRPGDRLGEQRPRFGRAVRREQQAGGRQRHHLPRAVAHAFPCRSGLLPGGDCLGLSVRLLESQSARPLRAGLALPVLQFPSRGKGALGCTQGLERVTSLQLCPAVVQQPPDRQGWPRRRPLECRRRILPVRAGRAHLSQGQARPPAPTGARGQTPD